MFRKRSPRLYHNQLNKFKLELNLNIAGSEFFGILGDLSEEGLCAVIPAGDDENEIATEIGAEIRGSILGKEMSEVLEFDARVAWQDMAEFRNAHSFLLGIEFLTRVALPAPLQEFLNEAVVDS